MRYVGSRHPLAASNPLRSMQLFRPAAAVFGRPTATDRLVYELRTALSLRDGWARAYAKACKKLGWANGTLARYRRANQRDAMRELNAVRAAVRANERAILTAKAKLLDAGVTDLPAGCA